MSFASASDDLFSLELIPLTKVKLGDHLAVESSDGSYYHHGIFIGDGDVIDYGAENKTITTAQGVVRKIPLTEFVGGHMVYRVKYHQKGLAKNMCQEKDPMDVVKMAVELYQNPSSWSVYDLLGKNCEHFATYCKTGKGFSVQVVKKIKALFTAAAASSASLSSFSGM